MDDNVQGLVHVVDTSMPKGLTNLHVNLNFQVAKETPPANPIGTLQRAFLNDIVAIDADRNCENFLIVSRGGSYVMRAPGRWQAEYRSARQCGAVPDREYSDRRRHRRPKSLRQ